MSDWGRLIQLLEELAQDLDGIYDEMTWSDLRRLELTDEALWLAKKIEESK